MLSWFGLHSDAVMLVTGKCSVCEQAIEEVYVANEEAADWVYKGLSHYGDCFSDIQRMEIETIKWLFFFFFLYMLTTWKSFH